MKILTALFSVSFFFSGFAWAKSDTKNLTKSSPALYNAIMQFEDNSCGAGSCYTELKEVLCQWTNTPQPKDVKCAYKNDAGETKQVVGPNAAKLAKEVEQAGSGQRDCGSGKCGFRHPQDILCRGPNEPGAIDMECSVTDHKRTAKKKVRSKTTRQTGGSSR